MAYVPEQLLVIRNVKAPPNFEHAEDFGKTVTVINLRSIAKNRSRVELDGVGFLNALAFDALLKTFKFGDSWTLEHLKRAAEHGPIDWVAEEKSEPLKQSKLNGEKFAVNRQRLILATSIGTVAQIAMVVAGHFVPDIQGAFMFGGLGLSLLAAAIYAAPSQEGWGSAAGGGVIAGGVSAFLGIVVSFFLGDVPASLLGLGTVGSMLTGLIGGIAGRILPRGGAAGHG